MRSTFDIDALRTMVTGVELGSFSRAAAQLGRSQSAVSMQLKKLEQQADQPLFRRNGRGLVPTEAGDALLTYARRIIALNDEAAVSLGTTAAAASVRVGLPQDLVEDVIPGAVAQFSRLRPGIHVEIRAGRNYALEEEVRAGRLDLAFGFFPSGSDRHGTLLASLPMLWFGPEKAAKSLVADPIPLVLYDHPCLFRQAALQALDRIGRRWRLSLTTPSLPWIWAALRSGQGISVRTPHRVPAGIDEIGARFRLPKLPAIELRMLAGSDLSQAALELRDLLKLALQARVIARRGRPLR
jgi:DNA-binding transcriptional LysR family regulator